MSRKLSGLAVLTLALCLLTGCSALLERTYSTAEPHSSKFWESEAAGTLRAENHQDVVNDLLLLVGRHQETATLRLYDFKSDLAVADTLEEAAAEVQQETPMGAYAVEFITTSSHAQRGYYEVAVRIGYRRTLEQLQAVVNATSPEALYSLLAAALDEGKTELAVRMGYWGENGGVRVEEAMAQLREERELTETVPWVVNYYPAGERRHPEKRARRSARMERRLPGKRGRVPPKKAGTRTAARRRKTGKPRKRTRSGRRRGRKKQTPPPRRRPGKRSRGNFFCQGLDKRGKLC